MCAILTKLNYLQYYVFLGAEFYNLDFLPQSNCKNKMSTFTKLGYKISILLLLQVPILTKLIFYTDLWAFKTNMNLAFNISIYIF